MNHQDTKFTKNGFQELGGTPLMEVFKSKEYRQMESKYLIALTFDGRASVAKLVVLSALLYKEFLGEVELSEAEKREFLRMLIDTSRRHLELIDWCMRECQKFISSFQEKDAKSQDSTSH